MLHSKMLRRGIVHLMEFYTSISDDIRTSKNQPDPNSRSSSRESASSKRDNSKFVTPMNNKAKVTPPPPSTVSNELTPDELDANSKKTKSLLNEYLSILDVNVSKYKM